jgi:hypothetical protein
MRIHSEQNKRPKLTDAERHKRFVETAKKVEASERVEDFDNAFASVSHSGSLSRSDRTSKNSKV